MRDDDRASLTAAARLLLSGSSWPYGPGQPLALTYSFMATAPFYGLSYGSTDFQPPSEVLKAGVRKALATWSAVAAITFTEVDDTFLGGDLRVGMANIDYWAGYAHYPGTGSGGDMIFDSQVGLTMRVIVHEIGHALGLKHPHDAPLLTGVMDSTDYTAMSYLNDGIAETPMVLDILAIQELYGANPSYRAGDDTYAFPRDGTSAGMSPDYNLTVYDTGGRNTFDFSATANPLIDLRQGHFSAVAQAQDARPWRYQVAIALGTVIHGAIGGSEGSTFHGNDAGNTLTGGAGADIFHPGTGADTIDGKAGQDSVVYPFARAEATLARFGGEVLLRRAGVTDRLAGIEALSFADADLATDLVAEVAATQVEAAGVTRLLDVAGWYALRDAADAGPWITYGGSLVSAGQFGAALPFGAEPMPGGWRVAWRVPGADQYVFWGLDTAGAYTATLTPVVSGSDPVLLDQEPLFAQDLNGDGAIGPKVTVLEAFGATRLVQVGARFALRDAADAGPWLSYAGSPVVAGQFGASAPIGAEAVPGGYRVAWKVAGADQYVIWAVDAAGRYAGTATAVVSGAAEVLIAEEPGLRQDLNGDGSIGSQSAAAVALPAGVAATETQGVLRLLATLDRAPPGAASVRWRIVPGTADPAAHDMPEGQGGLLAFDATGPLTREIVVLLNDEAHKPEGDEAFAIELYDPEGLAIAQARTDIGLADHYVPPPAVPLAMLRGGAASQPAFAPYAGPVSYLDQMFVLDGDDPVVISAAAPNVFLRTGAGNDALQVSAGQNVVDAGAGSNFVTGGSGADVFFLDARGATEAIWSTVVGFAPGDAVTIWGIDAAGTTLTFNPDGGVPGYTGLTLHAGVAGRPAVVLTLAGYAGTTVPHFFAVDPVSGSPYLYLTP